MGIAKRRKNPSLFRNRARPQVNEVPENQIEDIKDETENIESAGSDESRNFEQCETEAAGDSSGESI